MFYFYGFAKVQVWFNIEDGVPQGGGFYNKLRLKVHVIKVNKGKNKTIIKGHLFQDEYWENHPSVGVHFNYYG